MAVPDRPGIFIIQSGGPQSGVLVSGSTPNLSRRSQYLTEEQVREIVRSVPCCSYTREEIDALLLEIGSGVYTGDSPTTLTVGGLQSGSNIEGLGFSEILEAILVPYIAPTFSSFSFNQPTPVEVGNTLTGTRNFTFTLTQPGNVLNDSIEIIDVTGGNTVLLDQIGKSESPVAVDLGSVQKTSPASHSWRARATNTQLNTFLSNNVTIQWLWRLYSGTSEEPSLDEAGIKGLETNLLASTEAGVYSLAAGGYKYFAWPNSFGSPAGLIGFRDVSTGFNVSMADASDDMFFINDENGWSYGLVDVTNIHGITTSYRVYRTKFVLGGSITIQVT